MEELANSKWISTKLGTPPLKGNDLHELVAKLNHNWKQIDEMNLEKDYKFTNFNFALDFANLVGKLSDELDHHPDLHLSWGKCKVQISTHSIGGIAEMDFVYASRVEKIYKEKFEGLLSK